MKVAFFSNFLNHHQLPFCLAMDRLTNGQFTFIATTAIPEEQLRLGYRDMNKAYPFVLTTYDSSENQSFATKLAIEADIVISGDAPEVYTKKRMEKNKITFRYSERIYKEGFYKAFHPRGIFSRLIQHTRYMRKPLYMLCASAYTSFDYALSVAYLGKTYKWGYFPEVKMQNMDELFIRKRRKKIVSILWAGRLIRWKHPEASILLAEKLKAEGFVFELDIIGSGQMEIELQEMITQKKLSDCVHMLGSMPPEAVRKHMEAADVYLFTSDFNEGWGAVLNESMNSGCAVVASHAIGSVPFLMKDGENGLIYKNGSIEDLYRNVKSLLDSPYERERLGRNAYLTLEKIWNADIAAERLLLLTDSLLSKRKNIEYNEGPCSRAPITLNCMKKGNDK